MDRRRGTGLVDEPQDQAGTLEILPLQKLHRDAASQDGMLRQIDDAHRAVTDQLAQLVVVDLLPDHFPGTWRTRF